MSQTQQPPLVVKPAAIVGMCLLDKHYQFVPFDKPHLAIRRLMVTAMIVQHVLDVQTASGNDWLEEIPPFPYRNIFSALPPIPDRYLQKMSEQLDAEQYTKQNHALPRFYSQIIRTYQHFQANNLHALNDALADYVSDKYGGLVDAVANLMRPNSNTALIVNELLVCVNQPSEDLQTSIREQREKEDAARVRPTPQRGLDLLRAATAREHADSAEAGPRRGVLCIKFTGGQKLPVPVLLGVLSQLAGHVGYPDASMDTLRSLFGPEIVPSTPPGLDEMLEMTRGGLRLADAPPEDPESDEDDEDAVGQLMQAVFRQAFDPNATMRDVLNTLEQGLDELCPYADTSKRALVSILMESLHAKLRHRPGEPPV